MGVFFLISAAYLSDRTGRPFLFALAIAAAQSFLSFNEGTAVNDLLLFAGIVFAFCAFYFSLIIAFSNNLFMWWIMLTGVPLMLFLYNLP